MLIVYNLQDGPNAYSLQFTKISKRLQLFTYEKALTQLRGQKGSFSHT